MKKWTEKHLDFKRTSQISPEFKDVVGLYAPVSKTVYVDSGLRLQCAGTMRAILEHERVHARLDALGIKLPSGKEEALCAFLSLAATPKDYLTNTEYELKQVLYKNLTWTKPIDRDKIIIIALYWSEIKYTRKFDGLAE